MRSSERCEREKRCIAIAATSGSISGSRAAGPDPSPASRAWRRFYIAGARPFFYITGGFRRPKCHLALLRLRHPGSCKSVPERPRCDPMQARSMSTYSEQCTYLWHAPMNVHERILSAHKTRGKAGRVSFIAGVTLRGSPSARLAPRRNIRH